MKKWFEELSKTNRKILTGAIMGVGIIFLIIAFITNMLGLLIVTFACIALDIPFLYLYDKIDKEEKTAAANKKDKQNSIDLQQQKIERANIRAEYNTFYASQISDYVPPIGYEVTGWTTKTLKVAGSHHYIDDLDYIYKYDEVKLIHIPDINYPENAGFFTGIEQIGSLRQEVAIDFVQKYGDNYCFIGKIIDADSVEKNEETYFDIITEIRVPILKRATKK